MEKKSTLPRVYRSGGLVAAAFDADVAGETMAWRVAQQVPGIERLTPNQGKDWNEVLVRPEGSGNGWQQSRQELAQLWRWHGAAVALGRPEGYLSRITEVAREVVVKGNELSEKARAAMQRDLNDSLNRGSSNATVGGTVLSQRKSRPEIGVEP